MEQFFFLPYSLSHSVRAGKMKAGSCENTHRIRQNDRPFGRGQIIRYTDESGRVLVGGTDPRGDGCIMGL